MKKPTTKKLTLSTRTIAQLDTSQLGTVAGGSGMKTCLTCFCNFNDTAWGRI